MGPRHVHLALIVVLAALPALALRPAHIAHGQAPAPAHSAGGTQTTLPRQAHLAGYPQLHQQHTLSCEAAAASMATQGHLSEQVILAHMPHDPNPWRGFRGNVDGGQALADDLANYGIYAPPLAVELQHLGYQTLVITGTVAPVLLRYSIGVLRQPVVVWVTHYLGDWPAITGHAGGRSFTLVDGEHARLAIGYDANGIYTLDPLEGPRYDPWATFLRSWARFDHMGLLIATTLPRPAAPTIHAQLWPGRVNWWWTEPARPVASEVTLFRLGRPVRQLLLTAAPQPARTGVLSDTEVLTGTVLASAPPVAAMQNTAIFTPTSLLASPTWHAGPLALQVQLAQSVPYSLTVRTVDPLGLTSAIAVSPVALSTAAARPATPAKPLPPPVPTMVRAAIVGPRQVRWTWPIGDGLTYRVVSYRYLGSRPVDYLDLTLGHSGAFTRAVQQDLTYYVQVLAINSAGLSSPATPPIPAPVVASARLLTPIEAGLRHGGYGEWRWTALGASRFLVQSYAYAGPRVVELQRMSTTATTYRRRLTPGLAYYVMVQAVANDGEQTAPSGAARGLIYYPGHPVQQLRVQRLPGGRHRWTWAAQPGVHYRLQLTRYAGRRGRVLVRVDTGDTRWTSPPAPPTMTDYLQIWAVDAGGDVSAPVQQRA